MKTDTMTPFAYGDKLVRTTTIGGHPWFVAADVCGILGLENSTRALSTLAEQEEKITVTNSDGNPRAGIPHQVTYVNEPGLYRLIFKSRKAEARTFQHWAFHEVLPAIRSTGRFEIPGLAVKQTAESLPPSAAHYLCLLHEQIRAGVAPDLAARIAIRVAMAQQPQLPAITPLAADRARDVEIDDILARLEPDHSYTIPQICDMLPAGHRLRRGSRHSRASAVGKILSRAVRLDRLERDWDFTRVAAFRLPKVAEFQTKSEP